ncbi:DNA polymerase III subunit delta [Ectothiorhodospiraceae bacterium WFHF3C12]|nr:DNA polymerase III subunit delta [Ectothiorhodospiraceae bacterium WFHF3C12]
MRLKTGELDRHLQQGLRPVYLIAGDEPLLVDEALTALREAARQAGYTEREVLDADAGFDWGALHAASMSMSLFADRRIIELRLNNGKTGQNGGKAIAEYCQDPPPDVLLLINAGVLESRQRSAAWVKAVESAGALVQAWPVPLQQLPDWVAGRMRAVGLQPTTEAAALVAERSEGNLLAAVQEVEKLRLLHGEGALDVEDARAAVTESARFDVFDLSDAALAGDTPRVVRIARVLREEGVEPTLVLWALARELRNLAEVRAAMDAGESQGQVFQRLRIWKSRQALVGQAARRAGTRQWEGLLARAAHLDRVNKGAADGRPWDELVQLSTAMSRVGSRSR